MSIVACMIWVALVGCSEEAFDETVRTSEEGSAVRMAAAQRGIVWLVDHADQMPPGWAQPFLLRLQRVSPDDETAASIEAVLRNDSAPSRRFPLPPSLSDPRLLRPHRLTPILFELQRRKTVGEPYQEQVEVLRRVIEQDERGFWSRVKPTQRCVYLLLFRDLGLSTPFDFDRLYREIRRSVLRRPTVDVAADDQALYAMTHLILVEARYFQKYPEPERYAFMIPYFLRALEERLTEEASERSLDVSAEILACLSLIRFPEDEVLREARRLLISLQDRNGSWGSSMGVTPGRVHATLMGVLATIELPAEFRVDPDLMTPP